MRQNIICLSDLHISGNMNSQFEKDEYVNELRNTLEKIGDSNLLLLISGDIFDKGGNSDAVIIAKSMLTKLCENLHCDIMLVPGNHEICRNMLKELVESGEVTSDLAYERNDKYYYINDLIKICNELKLNDGIEISVEKAIVSTSFFSESNILLLGINSTYKMGIDESVGSVNLVALEQELIQLKEEIKNFDKLSKIAVLHHNMFMYESTPEELVQDNKEGWCGNLDYENNKEVKKIFSNFGIRTFISGHVHGDQTLKINEYGKKQGQFLYIMNGSTGVDFSQEKSYMHNTFSVIKVNDGEFEEQIVYICVQQAGKIKWLIYDNFTIDLDDNILESPQDQNKVVRKNVDISKRVMEINIKLCEILRKNHLFKTGHFHHRGHRMLSWIDTSYFFSSNVMIKWIAKEFTIIYPSILSDATIFLGLGIKGGVMMTSLRYAYPKARASYFPEPEKSENQKFNNYEKSILDSKIVTKNDKVVIFTDVVHTADTVKEFIKQYFFQFNQVTSWNVLSIFNVNESAHQPPTAQVIKFDIYNQSVNGGSKHIKINVEINCLMKMVVKKCTGDDECLIQKNGLTCIYEIV